MPWQCDKRSVAYGTLSMEAWISSSNLLSLRAYFKQLEEEEQEDKFELTVGVSDPEKVGELCVAGRKEVKLPLT